MSQTEVLPDDVRVAGEIELPIADLADARSSDRARQSRFEITVGRAFTSLGFVALAGSGITEELMEYADKVVAETFALPPHVLQKYVRGGEGKFQRGYVPYMAETAEGSDAADLKEFWMVRDPEEPVNPKNNPFGPNVFPAENPEFRDVTVQLLKTSLHAARTVMNALERTFSLAPGTLVAMTRGAETMERPIYYRSLTEYPERPRGAWRSSPHLDINLMTVMPAPKGSGLIVKVKGEWHLLRFPRDVLVADTGEMMPLVPGLRPLVSTEHGVLNPTHPALNLTEEEQLMARVSFPTFVHGLHDSLICEEPGSDVMVEYVVKFMRRIEFLMKNAKAMK